MGLGGPVWHASAATMRPEFGDVDMRILRGIAEDALAGVGDRRLGEWTEWTGRAFHLRRRLRAVEQRLVGAVVDVRGDAEEMARRLQPVAHILPPGWTE